MENEPLEGDGEELRRSETGDSGSSS
jgi:hypothetical protein